MFTENHEDNEKLLKVLAYEQCVYFCVHVAESVLHLWEEQFQDDSLKEVIKIAHLAFKVNRFKKLQQWLIEDSYGVNSAARDAYSAARFAASQNHYDAGDAACVVCYVVKSTINSSYVPYVVHYAHQSGKSFQWLYSLYQSIHKPHPFPNHYKTSNTINIAKAILKDNDFNSMPILADALEDENCTDTELLLHLRCNNDLWTPVDWVLTNLVK